MARPKREEQIPDIAEAIMKAAWGQIAADGAPALSLRAIARRLRITAPAIYNYYASRDELVTALVIEAFDSLADSLEQAVRELKGDPARELHEVGLAYRRWALSYPQRYQLIFGPPLPGYRLPRKKVLRSSARAMAALVKVIKGLLNVGSFEERLIPKSKIGDPAYYKRLQSLGVEADSTSLTIAVLIWGRLHGIVSLELTGNMLGADGEALLGFELQAIRSQIFRVNV